MGLLTKELRALRGPALVLAGYGVFLAWRLCAELRLDKIPELDYWADLGRLPLTASAAALGAWVLWSEDRRGTWSLLLTLPVSRARLLLTKLLAALLVLWPLTALPLLWTQRFIGVPGHVCGPVRPELLATAWHDWRLLPLGVRPLPDGLEVAGQRFDARRFGWQVLHPLPWQPERLALLCADYQQSPVDAEAAPWAVGKDLEGLPWRAPDVVVFDREVEPRLSVQPPLRVQSDAWVLAGTFDATWRMLLGTRT